MFILRHLWTGLSCWPITLWSLIIGGWEFFLKTITREREGLEDVFRDIGFTENSMLYPS